MTLDEFLATCPALPIQDSRHEFCSQREAVSDAFSEADTTGLSMTVFSDADTAGWWYTQAFAARLRGARVFVTLLPSRYFT